MYNGVGVQTARGTGTSGHVRKNLGSLRPLRHDVRRLKELRDKQPILREADPGIVHHNELRKIEVQLLKMRELWENEYVLVSSLAYCLLEALVKKKLNPEYRGTGKNCGRI